MHQWQTACMCCKQGNCVSVWQEEKNLYMCVGRCIPSSYLTLKHTQISLGRESRDSTVRVRVRVRVGAFYVCHSNKDSIAFCSLHDSLNTPHTAF